MGFADASVCPSCRGRIEHATTCPHCGLDLTSNEVQQAWQALVVADQWIERARSQQTSSVPSEPVAETQQPPQHPPVAAQPQPPEQPPVAAQPQPPQQPPVAAQPQPPQQPPVAAQPQPPQHPPVAAQPQPQRSISAGSVLLALGATLILVAGTIFITVSWGSLGVLGRALVLLAVTALIGTLGWFVTRRGLRASAEAVWSVFFGLLTLDWFAARDQGLAGLDTWPFGLSASVWALLVIGATLVVVPFGRGRLSKELLAPSIVAGAASWFAAGSLAVELSDEIDGTEFWPALLATAVMAAVGIVLRRGTVWVGSWISFAGGAVFGLLAIGFAIVEAVDHPSLRELVVDASGLPLLVVVIAAVAGGWLVKRIRWPASTFAVAGFATLVSLPIEDAWPERGGFLAVAGLVGIGAWIIARENDWFRGARLTVAVATAGLALVSAPWVGRLLAVIVEGASADRTDDLLAHLRPDDAPQVGPWWVALVVTVGLAAALAGARRWPESAELRAHLHPAAVGTVVAGALATAAVFDLPAVAIGGALVAGGALLCLAPAGVPNGWRWVGPAVVALAPLSTLSSWPASVIVWPAAGLVLGAVALRTRNVELRCAAAFAATGWGLGTVLPALELVDGDDRWTALALVVAGLVGLAASLFAVRDDLTHIAVEAASAALGAAGIALGSVAATLGFASLTWTIAGTGVVVLGLVSKRRTWYLWVGSAVVALAPLWTWSSWPAAVIIWPVAGLVLAVVAVRTSNVELRCAAAFAATGWGLGTVLPVLELIDGDDRWTALALVVAGLVGLAASMFAVRDDLTHIAVEAASAALGAAGIALGSVESTLGFASLTWTIAGTGVVVLGLTSKRRTWYRWVGSGLLGVAYVLRLAASDVDVVEAYTLPFAAFLLAVGLWAMRDPNGPGSVRALLPGVVLAMLPSLPYALDEPTGLRALLLGIGAALFLAVGTWRRWKVPFVAGALVLAALALANLGPVALAVPRWALLAAAGVVLGGAGITWEDRVRDGRAAIRYVGAMR